MVIDKDGDVKIAQYGQWDGYPSGQGRTIVSFLQTKKNRDKLLSKLKRIRFLEIDGRDKDFVKEYNKNVPQFSHEPDNRTPERKRWFDTYISRNIGGKILETIAKATDDEIVLIDETETAKHGGWVEYTYIVNFKRGSLTCKHYIDDEEPLKEYDLDALPTPDEFVEELETIIKQND